MSYNTKETQRFLYEQEGKRRTAARKARRKERFLEKRERNERLNSRCCEWGSSSHCDWSC